MAKELTAELRDRIKRDAGDLAGVFSRPGDDLNVLVADAFDAAKGDYRLAIATLKYWMYTDFATRDPREFGGDDAYEKKLKALETSWQMWLKSPLPQEEPGLPPAEPAAFPTVFSVVSARPWPLPRSGV